MLMILCGCPPREAEETEQAYHIGSWAGSVTTVARLVLRQEPEYWNGAWRVEGDVRLDEFQDGTVKGNATGDLFVWEKNDPLILEYDQIASGHWNKYTEFVLELTGTVDETGYTLDAVELPLSLIDPNSPNGAIIDFWDFLYPMKLQGTWPEDGSRVMSGESMRVQGNDYGETSQLATFREFSVEYTWNVRKL
jgi:hypothetical protein